MATKKRLMSSVVVLKDGRDIYVAENLATIRNGLLNYNEVEVTVKDCSYGFDISSLMNQKMVITKDMVVGYGSI